MLWTLAILFASSIGLALSGALMPGPLFTAVVGESGRRGAVAGPLFIAGHAILEAALVILVTLGLGPILGLPAVFIAISLSGGLIMLWMAFSMFRSLPTLVFDMAKSDKRYGHLVWSGVVLSLSNPYWTVWWVTIGLGWISRGMKLGPAGVIAFYAGHIVGDLSWYSFLSFAIAKGRRFLTDKRYRIMIGVCAGALAGFGLWFILSGIKAFVDYRS
jgi:threonine/homoserine/homoserine lactone efflux protein